MRVVATGEGVRRGVRATLPLTVGLIPFGLVVGALAQAQGLSALEQARMNALVYAGASQIPALEIWTDPALAVVRGAVAGSLAGAAVECASWLRPHEIPSP